MTGAWLHQNDRRRLFLAAVTTGLYLALAWIGALRPLAEGFQWLFRPLQRPTASFAEAVSGLLPTFRDRDTVLQENEQLRAAVARVLTENAHLRDQIENSADIARQLSFLKPRELQSIFSQIIGKAPIVDHETLLLDRGTGDGVQKGAPVVVGEGILIGKIFSVTQHTSIALLLTDPQSRVAALIQNAPRSPGEIVGDRGVGLRMELIPRQDTLGVGETVVTSGIEPLIPHGLVIGTLAAITTPTGELFHEAEITPIAPPKRQRVVSILRVREE